MAPWEYTLANLLSDAGYSSAIYGKWHLGDEAGRLPTDQGFDEWWGIKNTTDESGYTSHPQYPPDFPIPKIWEAVAGQTAKPVDNYNLETRPFMDEGITQRTVEFIRRNAANSQPFFVYASFTHIHPPMIPHPDFAEKSGSKHPYPNCISELDYRAGQILDALAEAGIAENTIVVWNSDNAAGVTAVEAGSSGPWRGAFGGGWEGSIRAPAIIRWPGRVPAGVVTDEIVATYDWMPTLASLTGERERMPSDRPIDGLDLSELFLGRREYSSRDSFLFYGTDGEIISVKWKNIKVHFRFVEGDDIFGPYVTPQVPRLYDLIADPGEKINLAVADMSSLWMIRPALMPVLAVAKSAAQYAHIKPGEEFQGYPNHSPDNGE